MSLDRVRAALIEAYIDTNTGLTTVYENESAPEGTEPWAVFTLVPETLVPVTLGKGGEDEAKGIARIDLNYPLDTGEGTASAVFNLLREKFIAGQTFTNNGQPVRILSCGRAQGKAVNGWYQVSISINWSARIKRKEA